MMVTSNPVNSNIPLSLRGSVVIVGSVRTETEPVMRTWAFSNDAVGNYRDIIEIGTRGMVPLNFRSGNVSFVVNSDKTLLFATSPSSWFPSGRVSLLTAAMPLDGALTDFGIWPLTAAGDPRDVLVLNATNATSANVGEAWNRHHATVVLPKNARYLGIGGKFKALPPSTTGEQARQHIRNVQTEVVHVSNLGPTEFSDAREIRTTVHPDRVNHFPNPSIEADTSSFSGTGVVRSGDWSSDRGNGSWSLQVPSGATSRATVGGATDLVGTRPGRTYVLSAGAYIPAKHTAENSVARTLRVEAYNDAGVASEIAASAKIPNTEGVEHPVHVVFEVPTWARGLRLSFYNGSTQAGALVHYDDILLEEGVAPRGYFDGSFGGDYLWEGTVLKSRSFYYKNRAERYAALERTLRENIPMGLGYAVPKFGDS